MIHPLIQQAYLVLEGKEISKDLALQIAEEIHGEDVLDLISLSNKVKNRFCNEVHVCSIMNAKSGACKEDCRYCAQSAHHKTEIEVYDLKDSDSIVKEAKRAHESGVKHFGIVTSGTGYPEYNAEFQAILDAIKAIHKELPGMNVCASLGNLGKETTKMLAEAGIVHYNINIQVNPSKYKELVATTHSVEGRIETIELLKKNGIKVCSGGIIGLGETAEDRVEMAFALKELKADVIPLNILIPIDGTPLEGQKEVPVSEIAKTFALYRLIHPTKYIKFAAGRELRMKDFQALLMLAGANGLLTGGYLTTRGRKTEEDKKMISELEGFGYVS